MGYYIPVERHVHIFVEDVDPDHGKTVVFVHGWPLNQKMWEYQVDQLPQQGCRCITLDIRGYGHSDRPWDGYSYNRFADDIRQVMDALQLENVTLVGFSMGGATAIRYMARHAGHRVSKLALLGAAAPSFTQRPDFPLGTPREQVDAMIKGVYTDRPALFSGLVDNFFHRSISEKFRDWFQGLGNEASGHGTAMGLVALRDEDLRSDLPHVHVPTLILHGVHDKLVPFALGEAMQAGISGSKLVPCQQSGHGLWYDELDLINNELIKFIG